MSRDKRLQEITDILQNRKRIDVKQLEKLTFSSTSESSKMKLAT